MHKQSTFGWWMLACAALWTSCDAQVQTTEDPYQTIVDVQGNIRVPVDYRMRYVHLGSWTITDPNAVAGTGTHDVYTQREAAEAYRATGAWPDGTILVKDIRQVVNEDVTTGPVTYSGDQFIWFVMVKDTRNRFPTSPHWANGWGWALFNAGDPNQNVSPSFAQGCESCHTPAQADDWVFVRGYPTLR